MSSSGSLKDRCQVPSQSSVLPAFDGRTNRCWWYTCTQFPGVDYRKPEIDAPSVIELYNSKGRNCTGELHNFEIIGCLIEKLHKLTKIQAKFALKLYFFWLFKRVYKFRRLFSWAHLLGSKGRIHLGNFSSKNMHSCKLYQRRYKLRSYNFLMSSFSWYLSVCKAIYWLEVCLH